MSFTAASICESAAHFVLFIRHLDIADAIHCSDLRYLLDGRVE